MTNIEKLKAIGTKPKYIEVYKRRIDGATLEEAGSAVGMTKQGAGRIIEVCEQDIKDYDSGFVGLSSFARRAMRMAGIESKEQAKEQIEGGFLFHAHKDVSYRTHKKIKEWANGD